MQSKEEIKLVLDKLIGQKVLGLKYDFLNSNISINFKNDVEILFDDCLIVYDLGIVGAVIKDVSLSAGLGMVLEIKQFSDTENYHYCTLSRGFNDLSEKREIRLSFKKVQLIDD